MPKHLKVYAPDKRQYKYEIGKDGVAGIEFNRWTSSVTIKFKDGGTIIWANAVFVYASRLS